MSSCLPSGTFYHQEKIVKALDANLASTSNKQKTIQKSVCHLEGH
jgi:hypothetical protein